METTIWKLTTCTALFAQEAGGAGGGEAAPTGNMFDMLFPFIVLAGLAGFIVFLMHLSRRGQRAIERDRLRPPSQKPQSRSSAPSWMFPAGIIAVAVGVLAFGLGAAKGGAEARPGDALGMIFLLGLIGGGTNPLFFVGVPLGCYWLYRSAKGSNRNTQSRDARSAIPIDECNPKLTHCPDCGRHVSRLAPSCPHCGKPLTSDKTDS